MVLPNGNAQRDEPTQIDLDIVQAQLKRAPRDVSAIAHRCPCGAPDVVETPPRLADGQPFPTFSYATCTRLTREISTLESSGVMADMNQRLADDALLAGAYHAAHIDYEAARAALAKELNVSVPEVAGITAGGMPDRVKCLHALVAHSLAAGAGVNPLGDEALESLDPWWDFKPCIQISNLLEKES